MATVAKQDMRHKSKVVVDGTDRAPARSMLRAVGLQDDDFKKPFVAVANLASDVTPCNLHLARLSQKVKHGGRRRHAPRGAQLRSGARRHGRRLEGAAGALAAGVRVVGRAIGSGLAAR